MWHGHCVKRGRNPHEEDTVRTTARNFATAALLAAFLAAPAAGQTHLSLSVGVGSVFAGVGFGLHVGDHHPGSAFVGMSLGLGVGGHYGSSYGIYSDAYDGWGHGYGRSYSCWDDYWDAYWDPWSSWYWDCVAAGPYGYGSYRASSWRWRHGYAPTSFVYYADPWWAPWGPSWAYDPWGWYWDGYWDGRGWGYGWRGWDHPYGRVRTVHAGGGRVGVAVGRLSNR